MSQISSPPARDFLPATIGDAALALSAVGIQSCAHARTHAQTDEGQLADVE